MSTIGDIKKQLESLGISIATPGLTGQDRMDELLNRLEQHRHQLIEKRSHHHHQHSNTKSTENLSTISINELKTRCNLYS